MFALFYSLYKSMFMGFWQMYTIQDIIDNVQTPLNQLGLFLTSIFGDNTYANLGEMAFTTQTYGLINIIALTLTVITCIGIVVMAVKGVKKAFGIFFGHIR